MLLDDATTKPESKPGSLRILGRKEGLEQTFAVLDGDTAARIGDIDMNFGGSSRATGSLSGGDSQAAARGHSLNRIA